MMVKWSDWLLWWWPSMHGGRVRQLPAPFFDKSSFKIVKEVGGVAELKTLKLKINSASNRHLRTSPHIGLADKTGKALKLTVELSMQAIKILPPPFP